MYIITLLLMTSGIYGKSAHGLSPELQDYVLKIHNDYRKNEPDACQMERMLYDMDLEAKAARWADGCLFEHSGRGENMGYSTFKRPEKDLISTALKGMYDERKGYRYGQNSCSGACHYTQMVWATTNKVGCASKQCDYLRHAFGPAKDAWFFVCEYSPMGNMNGQKPYPKIGACASPCKEGQTQDSDGLCVGANYQEHGSGTQVKTSDACVDQNESCPSWYQGGECYKNPDYMLVNCKKSCGVCGVHKQEHGSGTQEETSDACVDQNESCPSWYQGGECYNNPDYMLVHCKKSCGVCGVDKQEHGSGTEEETSDACVDQNESCPSWYQGGECYNNPDYMLVHCKKSCGVCGQDVCVDGRALCLYWSVIGYCHREDYRAFMSKNCKKSCKICDPCVDRNQSCLSWAKAGECQRNPNYMFVNCIKSCHVCNICEDQDPRCVEWGKDDRCTSDPKYMDRVCKRACNLCGNEGKDVVRHCAEWARQGECTANPIYMHLNCEKSCNVC